MLLYKKLLLMTFGTTYVSFGAKSSLFRFAVQKFKY